MKEAAKYNGLNDFRSGYNSAYATARRLGVIDDIVQHMMRQRIYWTDEMITTEAANGLDLRPAQGQDLIFATNVTFVCLDRLGQKARFPAAGTPSLAFKPQVAWGLLMHKPIQPCLKVVYVPMD